MNFTYQSYRELIASLRLHGYSITDYHNWQGEKRCTILRHDIDNDIEKALEWENISIEEHISRYIADGLSKKDAVKKVAKDRGVSKQEIYKYSIDM